MGALALLTTSGCISATAVEPTTSPSRPLPVDTLVQGTITKNGEPVAGAIVVAQLWPADEDETEVGEEVDLHEVDRVLTDEDGRWSIRLDPARFSSRYLSDDYVNTDLYMASADQTTSWSIPFSLVSGHWRSSEQDSVSDPPARIDLDLGRSELRQVDSNGDTTEQDVLVSDW